jgi:Zn-dependent protease
MFGSIKIGRPFGINLFVHGTFWLLPAIVLLSGLSSGLEMALLDVGVVLAIFGCVALHELGHALAAKAFGIRTRDIVLYPIGGVARLERMPKRPWQEIVVALAGPAVNVAIVALLLPLMMLDGYAIHAGGLFESAGEFFWNRVLFGNVGLFVFNLIPAFPMDGGRVLRALAAMVTTRARATEFAANIGAAFAVLFGLVGVGGLLGVPGLVGLGGPMLLVIAFFLFTAGRAELAAVRYEDEQRQYYTRTTEPQVRMFGIPVARPVDEPRAGPVNGWEYDARRRVWVEWRDGYPIRVVPAAE